MARRMMLQIASDLNFRDEMGASRPALDIAKIFKGRFTARQIMWQNAREFEFRGWALRVLPLT